MLQRILHVTLLACLTTHVWAQSVPSEYQSIYSNMESQISAFAAKQPANPGDPGLLFAPQSLIAISGRYTDLLQSTTMDYGVVPELDWFVGMGSNAVTVHINFPILVPEFHQFVGHPENYQKFVDFYARFVQEAHKRNLKVIVEAIADSASPGTNTADFGRYIKTLSWDQWVAGRAENAGNIAKFVKPDYLTGVTEQTTEKANSGHTEAGTATGSLQILTAICNAVKLADSGMPCGGGPASWETDFDTVLANAVGVLSLDFVDVHVYPVNRGFLDRLTTAADVVERAGKRMMISEVWGYKIADSELNQVGYGSIFSRDVFSFWRSLDQQLLGAVVRFGKSRNLIAVSPFWSQQFFADLDYNAHKSDSPAQLSIAEQQAAQKARDAGTYTSTGAYWATLSGHTIAPPGKPDKTPPAPTNLHYSISGSTVTLSWQSGGGTTVDFVVLRGNDKTAPYKQGSTTATTWKQNPTKAKAWNYSVKARDKYMRSSVPSNSVTVTVPK